jgi:hypothetical protein
LPVVIFLGDNVQLSPVLDSPVYNSSCKLPAALHGVLVWKDFKYSVNLKTIVCHGIKEQELKDVLLAIREYKITPVRNTNRPFSDMSFSNPWPYDDFKFCH